MASDKYELRNRQHIDPQIEAARFHFFARLILLLGRDEAGSGFNSSRMLSTASVSMPALQAGWVGLYLAMLLC